MDVSDGNSDFIFWACFGKLLDQGFIIWSFISNNPLHSSISVYILHTISADKENFLNNHEHSQFVIISFVLVTLMF